MRPTKADQLTAATLAVFRLNGAMLHWGDRFAAPHGLTSARWQMLGALALAERPQSAPQIGARMGVTRQAAQRQLDLLEQEGLVEPLANPQHKRSPLYRLTAQGTSAYQALDRQWRQHAQALASRFSTGEIEATLHVLSTLLQAHAQEAETSHAA